MVELCSMPMTTVTHIQHCCNSIHSFIHSMEIAFCVSSYKYRRTVMWKRCSAHFAFIGQMNEIWARCTQRRTTIAIIRLFKHSVQCSMHLFFCTCICVTAESFAKFTACVCIRSLARANAFQLFRVLIFSKHVKLNVRTNVRLFENKITEENDEETETMSLCMSVCLSVSALPTLTWCYSIRWPSPFQVITTWII